MAYFSKIDLNEEFSYSHKLKIAYELLEIL